jgi:hypothetical protein
MRAMRATRGSVLPGGYGTMRGVMVQWGGLWYNEGNEGVSSPWGLWYKRPSTVWIQESVSAWKRLCHMHNRLGIAVPPWLWSWNLHMWRLKQEHWAEHSTKCTRGCIEFPPSPPQVMLFRTELYRRLVEIDVKDVSCEQSRLVRFSITLLARLITCEHGAVWTWLDSTQFDLHYPFASITL